MSAARAAPLSAGVLAAEAAAAATAAALSQQSLEAFALVRGDAGTPREDALVNRRVAITSCFTRRGAERRCLAPQRQRAVLVGRAGG